MFKSVFVLLLLWTSVCYAHKVDGKFHTTWVHGRITTNASLPEGHPNRKDGEHKHGANGEAIARNYHGEHHGGNGPHAQGQHWHYACVEDDNGVYHNHEEGGSNLVGNDGTIGDDRGTGTPDGTCSPRTGVHGNPIGSTNNNNDPPSEDTPPTGDSDNSDVRSTVNQPTIVQAPISSVSPLLITEWMLIDLGSSRPQWIEMYNPSSAQVNLSGYTLTYAVYESASKYKHVQITLSSFTIPAESAVILASHDITHHVGDRFGGIETSQIYQLNLNAYLLKRGWLIEAPNGNEVHRTGKAFRNDAHPTLTDPPVGNTVDGFLVQYRVSHKHSPSAEPEAGEYYYGSSTDVSSPGYYAAAPAAPTIVRPKLMTTWGQLKRRTK